MRFIHSMTALLIFATLPLFAADKIDKQTPCVNYVWGGISLGGFLLAASPPANGEITSSEQLAKIWSGWRVSDDKPPAIDFTKQMVVVHVATDKILPVGYVLDDKGQFRFAEVVKDSTASKGSFCYTIVVLRRDLVKSFQNTPVSVDELK